MDVAALLDAYDSQLREDAEVERAVSVVRHPPLLWAVFGDGGMVTYRSLAGATGADLDALIEASLTHFRDGTDVRTAEWKTRGHDAPEDLGERLASRGFVAGDLETVMVGRAADLAVEVEIPGDVTISRVEVGPHLRDEVARAHAMQMHVFGGPGGQGPERVADQISADPAHLQLWVAESGGQVIAAGSLDVVRGTDFAGLWGGAVLAEWRGRGIYRALVAARARAAVELGVLYLHSDCSAMSQPILERSGLVARATEAYRQSGVRGCSPLGLFHSLSELHVSAEELVDHGGEILFLLLCYGLNESPYFLVEIDGKVQFRVWPEELAPFCL